jgi:CRP-like cAMP-binding protein
MNALYACSGVLRGVNMASDPKSGKEGRWAKGSFMAGLGDDSSHALLRLGRGRQYGSGATLLVQGDRDTYVYLLSSVRPARPACVKVTARTENGGESLLGVRVSGDIVGELSALRRGERTATVTTCAPIIAYRISHEAFAAYLDENREARDAFSRMIADRLEWANRRRLDFAGYDVTVRLARVLVDLTQRHGYRGPHGYEVGVKLSQPELGRLLGSGVDAIGRAVGQLRHQGLVVSQYRNIVITDLDGLRRFADMR